MKIIEFLCWLFTGLLFIVLVIPVIYAIVQIGLEGYRYSMLENYFNRFNDFV
jgi:hypothetical protein